MNQNNNNNKYHELLTTFIAINDAIGIGSTHTTVYVNLKSI